MDSQFNIDIRIIIECNFKYMLYPNTFIFNTEITLSLLPFSKKCCHSANSRGLAFRYIHVFIC